jgi:DNA polymerase-1
MMVTINPSQGKVLLIDTSYYVFYRYFATYNWYRRQVGNADVSATSIMSDEAFVDKYTKMFEKTLMELCKKNKISKYSNIIFVRDCSRENIWRHKHYDAYKATRDEKSQHFNKDVFPLTYHKIIPNLQAKLGVCTFGHPCLEADDVIAIMTNMLLDNPSSLSDVTIITNDNDYIQLLNHPALCLVDGNENKRLCIRNLQDKDICERVGCTPGIYCEVKKILGDKSDNIPPIMKKCGDKTAHKLASNPDALKKLLETTPSAQSQYSLNEMLVDFKCIPVEYQDEVRCRVTIG